MDNNQDYIEVRDEKGKVSQFHPVMTLVYNDRMYCMMRTLGEEDDMLLLRQFFSETQGVSFQPLGDDDQEIAGFLYMIATAIGEGMQSFEETGELNLNLNLAQDTGDCYDIFDRVGCGCTHGPREFCYCDMEDYLQ